MGTFTAHLNFVVLLFCSLYWFFDSGILFILILLLGYYVRMYYFLYYIAAPLLRGECDGELY